MVFSCVYNLINIAFDSFKNPDSDKVYCMPRIWTGCGFETCFVRLGACLRMRISRRNSMLL